jgi:hypothetical protein
MLEPQEVELSCYIGADYVDEYSFWADEAQTEPYDFSGWTQFTMQLGDTTYTQTLDTNGDGLVVDLTNGTITANISRVVTASELPGSMSYAISALDENSKLGFLMLGPFIWKSPV